MVQRFLVGNRSCKDAAIRLLSRRDYSEAEFATKLAVKGYPEDEITDVTQWCREAGYLDDERYIQQQIRHFLRKGYGELKIRYVLRQKMISDDMIQHVLDAVDIDWFELARRTAIKKYTTLPIADDPKEYARRVRFLQSRGFNPEQIQFALKC